MLESSEPVSSSAAPSARTCFWLIVVIVVGALVRLTISFISIGSDDAILWNMFAKSVRDYGLLRSYQLEPMLNHPLATVLWARFSLSTDKWFEFTMRLPVIAADLGSAIVLAKFWWEQRGPKSALLAAGGASLLPLPILISGYHCNTDAIFSFFSLLSAVQLSRKKFFAGGLALGAAINIKLIPVLLLPAAFSLCRNKRDFLNLFFGLLICVIPFLPLFISVPDAVWKNMITYASNPDHWGFPLILGWIDLNWKLQFVIYGKWLIIAGVMVLCAASWWMQRWNGRELFTMVYAIFLVLAPGFGVQYTICAFPLLMSVSLWRGWAYGLSGGIFVGLVYVSYLMAWAVPLVSKFHSEGFPLVPSIVGLIAWAVLVEAIISLLHRPAVSKVVPRGFEVV